MTLLQFSRGTQLFILGLGLAIAVGFISLSVLPTSGSAQNTATANQTPIGLQCSSAQVRNSPPTPDPLKGQKDPFEGQLAGPNLPQGLLPINDSTRKSIFDAGLPCQESVSPGGQETVAADNSRAAGLVNLQRGFDFYSWRTFLSLNSPTNRRPIDQAQADDPTVWESMGSFKELLDVMLPADEQPPVWPTDPAGMKAESERLVPAECRVLHSQMPDRRIVKMIEESFNEPFKTGPLIDQRGHYAIFDILMNRQMFNYIMLNHLNTKTGQAANSSLAVDFPAGNNKEGEFGAFMLKVSWKILTDQEIADKDFHTVKALVLTPPLSNSTTRKCLPETLGLIGFHAVHKTATRAQWIWTSFEHVKNVPDKDEVLLGKFAGPYNFYNPTCKTCDVNATPPTPWDPDPALELRFRRDDSFKSQIVRETPLTPATKNMNAIFQSMLSNSVWKNYMLINTQWPSAFGCANMKSKDGSMPDPKTDFLKQPDMTCSPAPTFMANSTLETYSQGDTPLTSSSCIACHENAVSYQKSASNPQPGKPNLNQSDFTFILEKAQ
jgi:hypothetical protein